MKITDETGEKIEAVKDNIKAIFSYSESCKNIYKHLRVFKDGKKSNIRTLRKLYNSKA